MSIGTRAQPAKTPRPKPPHPGFTLMEMLVVAAVIAILAAMLMPSLQRARAQALTAKCQAHQRSIVQAAGGYTAMYAEWLPGSPGTTGAALLGRYCGRPGDDEAMPVAPAQIWDYANPLAADMMGHAMAANRAARYTAAVNGVFACPANENMSMPFYMKLGNTGSFRVQPAVSYATVRNFMMWAAVTADGAPWGAIPPFFEDGNPAGWDGNISASSGTRLPRNYLPRLDRVGTLSEKIFIADSSRYTDYRGVSHNVHWRGADVGGAAGGAFSSGSPTLRPEVLRSYWLDDPQRRYAYRHAKGSSRRGLVAAYYDGHAAWVSERRSRLPNAWYPKGTIIPAGEFNDATLELVQNDLSPDGVYEVRR